MRTTAFDAVLRRAAFALAATLLCVAVAGAALATARSETTTLRQGAHGAAVKKLQRKLGLRADGEFGPQTTRALKRFQRRHHLPADGVVSKATSRALRLGSLRTASNTTGGQAVGEDPPAERRRSRVALPPELVQIAECESGGDPRSVSKSGQYRGKYQFSVSTWRSLGGKGDPARAPEWLQDRLALKLYRRSGPSQWGACAP